MLDYKTINEAYSLAEKAAAKKATEPDEMDLAGAPLSSANKEEGGILNKFLKNVGKARKNLSKNVEKSKENLSKNVAKTKDKLGLNEPEPKGEVNKAALGKLSLGQPAKYDVKEELNLPKPKTTEEHKEAAQGHLQKLLGQAKKAAEEHPAAAGALGALAAGAGALGVKKLLSRKKKTA